ncbi:uncharacterized protein N7496_011397 [Penicillium cataractarum]|uniref:LicD/FKTN/FKRP nucleotidyltransferase domain-containing protein n=1 Tax=Penicillium cataractarum TaxID=2100454 RepID=A0A9W9RHJ7_9EURO|nr:uncharacterized protein N7496_011397 [Penicillium cataractarum]KAJ5358984.1 hypothetical protein N7496_011397 [Penicillium cataractarum]
MQWRTWATLASVLWSTAATALPSPEARDDSSRSSNKPYTDPTLKDPLWLKYGLNASAEYKYFHEPGRDDILGHYDIRFFTTPVSDTERAETLTHMIRAYLNFFDENDLETWIAHGTLLGWWWNGKILPWDWDMDTQVPDTTLAYLADHYNQTIVEYVTPGGKEKRDYLLDINPWSRQRERGQGHNIIDARFIDITTGLYIDITGLSRLELDAHPDIWQCKNFHKYRLKDIYPLRRTTFEGAPAKVPFQYDALLMEEYTESALTTTSFHNHTWFPSLAEWISDETIANLTLHLPDDGKYE